MSSVFWVGLGGGGGNRGRRGGLSARLRRQQHVWLAGGIVASFVWLPVTSLLLGGAAGLVVASALKRLKLQGAHQVCLHRGCMEHTCM